MKNRGFLAVAATLVLTSGSAWAAEEFAPAGKVVSLEILYTTSDSYVQRHGSLVLKDDAGEPEYRWGGTSCPGKSLSSELVAVLVQVYVNKRKIAPIVEDGAGDNKCIVGFTLVK